MKLNREIAESVKELFCLQKEKKDFDRRYEEVRKKESLKISNFIFTNGQGQNSFTICLKNKTEKSVTPTSVRLKVTRVRKKNLIWDSEELKKILGKQEREDIILKEYRICDMEGLVKYLKTLKASPEKIKEFIEIKENIDTDMLEWYADTGMLDESKLKKCCRVKLGEPYIRITEQKENDEEI